MNKHVLIIDDDHLVMNVYEAALRKRGFEVTRFGGEQCVDEALQFLRERAKAVDIIVVDIMMPPGEALKDQDTDQGMKTGVFLLKMLKDSYPDLPLLVLTNVQNEETLELVRRVAPQTKVLRKAYCLPFDLADEIKSQLGGGK